MAESVPSAAERKPGVDEVNSFRTSNRSSSLSAHVIPSKHGSKAAKSSAYKSRRRFLLRRRNRGEDGASVTTSHLFWPNQRRELCACYQTSYGIQLSALWKRMSRLDRGAGGSSTQSQRRASTQDGSWNFLPNESRSPTPPKKCAARATRIPNERPLARPGLRDPLS